MILSQPNIRIHLLDGRTFTASIDDLGEEEIDFSTGTYRGVVSEEDVNRQIQQDRPFPLRLGPKVLRAR